MAEEGPNPFLEAAEKKVEKTLRKRAMEQVRRRERFAASHMERLTEDGRNIRMPDGRQFAYFTIPMPPSMNNIWNHIGDRRVRTEAYDKWKTEAGWMIRAQKIMAFSNPVSVDIRVERLNGQSDIDNRIKPVLDLLQDLQIIPNDNLVICVRCRWWQTRGGAKVAISEASEKERENAQIIDAATRRQRKLRIPIPSGA